MTTEAAATQPASPSAIQHAADASLAAIEACYDVFLTETPELNGHVLVRFDIEPTGVIDNAIVKSSTMRHPGLEGCLLSVVRGWQFSPSSDTIAVEYPFAFKPAATTTATTVTAPATPHTEPQTSRKPPRARPSKTFVFLVLFALILGLVLLLSVLQRSKRDADSE